GNSNLILHVVRQMRQGVALLQATMFSDFFVTTCKGNRLERKERNLLRIVESKTNNRTDLVVVDSINQGRNENDLHSRFVQVIDGAHLHIEEVANLPVTISVV